MMNHSPVFLRTMKRALSTISILLLPVAAWAQSPNVLIILADDMGYSELGCMGGNAAPPGHVDAQIALVKQIKIHGKNVFVPPKAAGHTVDSPSSRRKKELRKRKKALR